MKRQEEDAVESAKANINPERIVKSNDEFTAVQFDGTLEKAKIIARMISLNGNPNQDPDANAFEFSLSVEGKYGKIKSELHTSGVPMNDGDWFVCPNKDNKTMKAGRVVSDSDFHKYFYSKE